MRNGSDLTVEVIQGTPPIELGGDRRIHVELVSYNGREPVINIQSEYMKDGEPRRGKRPAIGLDVAEQVAKQIVDLVLFSKSNPT